ncbi:5-oxoprolinase subunit B family protein [Propionicimonas sp.]|uniref:5-oxoprolinase subunit B family protein n=1 Tax=Propionicimonas sp. TaxID=1955623 RepID=UPI0039E4AF48
MTATPEAPRLLPCGDRAFLIECADPAAVRAALEAADLPAELVPAARTVLVLLSGPAALDSVRAEARRILAGPVPSLPAEDSRTVVVPVRYTGEDLAEVAERTGLTPTEVVAAHTGHPWRVAFGGFAPGFAYLDGGDPRLAVPRKATPRTAVPAGSVGLAGEFSGIYPRASPGGWQLIGRTDVVLWDAARTPPALLRPGWWVRFEEVR